MITGKPLFIVFMLLLASLATAEMGINCKGSRLCHNYGGQTAVPEEDQIIYHMAQWTTKDFNPNRTYYDGEHIACYHKAVRHRRGAVCAFTQHTPKDTPGIRGPLIGQLFRDLFEHSCSACGSIPLVYHDGSNDPTKGILTVNFVRKPQCE